MIEIIEPASRAAWLDLRKNSIGASESATLLGLNPFRSIAELWAEKSGKLRNVAETPAMRRGRMLESVAIDFLREERPAWVIKPNVIGAGGKFIRDVEAGISCTPDAFVENPEREGFGIVQVKSVSEQSWNKTWQADGGIEPPMYVAIQTIHEATLAGAHWAGIAALVIGNGIDLHLIEVPINAAVMRRIRVEAATFWASVRSGTSPAFDYARDGGVINRIFDQDDGGTVDLSGNERALKIVARREALKRIEAASADAVKERKTIDAELIHALGNAACGILGDGRTIEAKTVRVKGYAVEPSTYRSVKVKGKTNAASEHTDRGDRPQPATAPEHF